MDYKFYICLDVDSVKELFTLKNNYMSIGADEFDGIHIEINKCHMNCESDENIQKFLDVTWFDIYTLNE